MSLGTWQLLEHFGLGFSLIGHSCKAHTSYLSSKTTVRQSLGRRIWQLWYWAYVSGTRSKGDNTFGSVCLSVCSLVLSSLYFVCQESSEIQTHKQTDATKLFMSPASWLTDKYLDIYIGILELQHTLVFYLFGCFHPFAFSFYDLNFLKDMAERFVSGHFTPIFSFDMMKSITGGKSWTSFWGNYNIHF